MEKCEISFTKNPTDWNESSTLRIIYKYKKYSIGEFQIHNNRDGVKFRFNRHNFHNLIENIYIDLKENVDEIINKIEQMTINNITNINELDKGVLKLVCDTRGIVIPISEDPIKSHPWRLCPTGEHYVKAHEKKLKSGKTGHWRGTCRINPSGKEIYTSDEINEIANHFLGRELKYPQLYKEKGWNDYDLLIAGWCQFWNDTFSPSEKLSPDYIKALIATESKFKIKDTAPNKKKGIGLAQGLVQLTESTVTLLSNGAHELSDHYFEIDKKDIFDSNINICAAIRWLFRKKETAQARLKRIPTWYEVLLEYKGVLVDDSKKADQIRKDLKDEITKLGLKR